MQNSLLFVFVLLSRQRSWWQVTPEYCKLSGGGKVIFQWHVAVTPKQTLIYFWVKSVGNVQAFQNPVVFLVCLSGKQFCFVSWRSPFQHTAQVLPPQGTMPVLPFSTFSALRNAGCHLAVAKCSQWWVKVHADSCWNQKGSSVTLCKLCFFSLHANNHHEWFCLPETLSTFKGRALLGPYEPSAQVSSTKKKREIMLGCKWRHNLGAERKIS